MSYKHIFIFQLVYLLEKLNIYFSIKETEEVSINLTAKQQEILQMKQEKNISQID
jgi:hypothetical protein